MNILQYWDTLLGIFFLLASGLILYYNIFFKEKKDVVTTATSAKENSSKKKVWSVTKTVMTVAVMISIIFIGARVVYVWVFQWETIDIVRFSPDKWDTQNLGFQTVMTLEEPGKYRIVTQSGSHFWKMAYDSSGSVHRFRTLPTGMSRTVSYREKLPLPNYPFCYLIGKRTTSEEVFPIGYRGIIQKSDWSPEELMFSINAPQNWSSRGTPAGNFTHNKGSMDIKVQKKRTFM